MTHLKPLAAAFCAALTVASARAAMFFRTYSVEDALRGAFAFRNMTGGLDLLSVQVSEPRHVEFMTRFRAGPMIGYGALDVSAADTSRVSGYFFPLGINVSADDIRIDAPTRTRVVRRLAALLDSFYVSPEVGKRMRILCTRGSNEVSITGTRTARPSRSISGRISMTSLTTSTCKFFTACYPEVRNRNRIRSLNTGASAKPTARSGRPSGSRGTSGTCGSTGLSIRQSASGPSSRR